MSWLFILLMVMAVAAVLFGTPFSPGVVKSYWGARWPGLPFPLTDAPTRNGSIVPMDDK